MTLSEAARNSTRPIFYEALAAKVVVCEQGTVPPFLRGTKRGLQMDEVDYVIVGAGSAGCVMANRLSANGRHQVLLLEAGGSDARLWIKVPVGYAMTFADPKLNWGYVTEADAGLSGRRIYWPRGRVIGGSSSINAMETRAEAASRAERGGNGPVWVQDLSDQMHPFHEISCTRAAARGLPWSMT